MKARTRNWIIVLSYIAFIYTTLELVRVPTNALRRMGILRLTLVTTYLTAIVTMMGALATYNRRGLLRFALLAGIFRSTRLSRAGSARRKSRYTFWNTGSSAFFFTGRSRPLRRNFTVPLWESHFSWRRPRDGSTRFFRGSCRRATTTFEMSSSTPFRWYWASD